MSSNAFEEELLSLLPALRGFSKTLCRQTADAEDLVQETLAKALANKEKYVPYGSLKSWLFTIRKNNFCRESFFQFTGHLSASAAIRRVRWHAL